MVKKKSMTKYHVYADLPEIKMSCLIVDKRAGKILKMDDKPIQDVMNLINLKLGEYL